MTQDAYSIIKSSNVLILQHTILIACALMYFKKSFIFIFSYSLSQKCSIY